MMLIVSYRKGVRKGEELKASRYASAAATRDYITTCDIIPNNIYNKNKNKIVKIRVLVFL